MYLLTFLCCRLRATQYTSDDVYCSWGGYEIVCYRYGLWSTVFIHTSHCHISGVFVCAQLSEWWMDGWVLCYESCVWSANVLYHLFPTNAELFACHIPCHASHITHTTHVCNVLDTRVYVVIRTAKSENRSKRFSTFNRSSHSFTRAWPMTTSTLLPTLTKGKYI